MQDGYSHNFAFVASFVDEHLEWHVERLRGCKRKLEEAK